VASDPERVSEPATESPWDELDQGFFASAPPDVAEPAPEPMRFDDLEDVAQQPAQHRGAAWRESVTASARAVLRRLAPVRASAAATWRRVTPASIAAARTLARIGRAQTVRLLALLQKADARDRRLLAAGMAALVVVMGVSAGVVASRGNGPTSPNAGSPGIASTTPASPAFSIAPDGAREIATEDESLSPALSIAPDRDPLLSPFSAAPDGPTPAPPKRKHAKSVTHGPARAKVADARSAGKLADAKPASKVADVKPASKLPTTAVARPMFAR
jgi:hypothetical protein